MPEPSKTPARKAAPRKVPTKRAPAKKTSQRLPRETLAQKTERARQRVITGKSESGAAKNDAVHLTKESLADPIVMAATAARNKLIEDRLREQVDHVEKSRTPGERDNKTYVVTIGDPEIYRSSAIRRGKIKRGVTPEAPRQYVVVRGETEARDRQELLSRLEYGAVRAVGSESEIPENPPLQLRANSGWTEQVVHAKVMPLNEAVEVVVDLYERQSAASDGETPKQAYYLMPFDQLFREAQDLDEVQAMAALLVPDLPDAEARGYLDINGITVGQLAQLKSIVDTMRYQRS